MGDPFGPLPHFIARLFGRGESLVARRRQALAGLAADDVAESFLEALGAAVGREALFGAALLAGVPISVTARAPGRAGLAEPAGAVEGDREDEEADAAVEDPALGEADRDEEEDDEGADRGAEDRADVSLFDRERGEAEQRQQHQGGEIGRA